MHQHLQYFTFNSIINLLHTTGFKVIGIEKSGYGGSIYCAAVKTECDDFYNAENKIEKELPNFENAINIFLVSGLNEADNATKSLDNNLNLMLP